MQNASVASIFFGLFIYIAITYNVPLKKYDFNIIITLYSLSIIIYIII